MSSIILVDDSRIREQAFSQSRKLLKRIEQLEKHVRLYESLDQKQFNDWREVTFRREREMLETLKVQYESLRLTFIRTLALAAHDKISEEDAIAQIEEEEELYKSADLIGRNDLELQWKMREEFFYNEQEQIQDAEQREEDARSARRRARAFRQERLEEERRRERINEIGMMSDEELELACENSRRAEDWLWLALWEARVTSDATVFFRLWDRIHLKIKNIFSKRFANSYGMDFAPILEAMRSYKKRPDSSEELSAEHTSSSTPPSQESLKVLYRKLVRLLHPDLKGGVMTPWQQNLWMRAQGAFRTEDRTELNRLMILIHLRNGDLNQLRFSEILSSRDWLNGELVEMQKSIRSVRKSAAWGFSRRKDFGPVQRKVERELNSEKEDLYYRISDLATRLEIMKS